MGSTRYWVQFPHISGGVNFFTTINDKEDFLAESCLSCYEISLESFDAGQNPL